VSNTNPFGTDLGSFPNADANGVLDIDLGMQEVTGRDVLTQRLVRRQLTPPGSVIDCPNDCIDVRGFVSAGITQAELQALAGALRNELLKDEGITDVAISVTFDPRVSSLTIVEKFTSGYGPFSLTLNVSQVTLEVLVQNQGSAQ